MDLKIDEGKIISQNGEKIAVYKDKAGKVSAVSAVCPHMRCIVEWNNKDKSWDCPCHGSKFNIEGKVIKGPALKDLPAKKLDK
jgi:Rieske Fe-S protein